MELTVFLAQLWGPVILAVAVGMYVSRSQYQRLYRDLEKAPLAVLLFGMIAMAAGIVHVSAHMAWDSLAQSIVSLLGIGLLAKGVAFIVFPKLVDQKGDWVAGKKLVPLVALMMLLVGGYLTWVGYLS